MAKQRIEKQKSMILKEGIRKLPIRIRVAWGASLLDRVLQMYSSYFCDKYLQHRAVEYAWDFALHGNDNEQEREDLIDKIEDLMNEAEEDGYSRDVLGMGADLIEEIKAQDGVAVVAAVEYAARAFSLQKLYRQGLGYDSRIPLSYMDSLETPFYQCALDSFELARSLTVERLDRHSFDSVALDTSLEPLGADQVRGSKRSPKPPHQESLGSEL